MNHNNRYAKAIRKETFTFYQTQIKKAEYQNAALFKIAKAVSYNQDVSNL